MRDVNRIDDILKRLKLIWEAHPDLRLGQIILNAARRNAVAPETGARDVFYIEDEELIKEIELILGE